MLESLQLPSPCVQHLPRPLLRRGDGATGRRGASPSGFSLNVASSNRPLLILGSNVASHPFCLRPPRPLSHQPVLLSSLS